MLDIKFIRQNPEKVKEVIVKKQANIDIDRVLELDEKKREYLQKIENMRSEQNKLGKDDIAKARELKAEMESIDKELRFLLRKIPNPPLDTVPVGKDDTENVVLREEGKKPEFDF